MHEHLSQQKSTSITLLLQHRRVETAFCIDLEERNP